MEEKLAFSQGEQAILKEVKKLDLDVRKLGVKVEHLETKIDAVSEQHGSITEKLDSHTEMIGALQVDMTMVKDHLGLTTPAVA